MKIGDIKKLIIAALVAWLILSLGIRLFLTPRGGALTKNEYNHFLILSNKNDTKALQKFHLYFTKFLNNESLMIGFFKNFAKLKNPYVDNVLGICIKSYTKNHKQYLGKARIEKNLKEALFFLKRAMKNESKEAKAFMKQYENLSDNEIIELWKKEK